MTLEDKDYNFIEFEAKQESINVEKYSKVRHISGQYDKEFYKKSDDKEDLEIYEDILRGLNNTCKVPEKDLEKQLKKNNKVKLSDDSDMIIIKLYGSYDQDEKIKLENFEYDLLILEK